MTKIVFEHGNRTWVDRWLDRMVDEMPPQLAYVLCKHDGYHRSPETTAYLREMGLIEPKDPLAKYDYDFLNGIGQKLLARLELCLPKLVKAAESEPTPSPAEPAPDLSQPAAPTFIPDPDPTPPGVPDRKATPSDVRGNPDLADAGAA